jgi:hypothetical protein
MRPLAGLLLLLAAAGLVLAPLPAQDKDADAKAEKKDDAKDDAKAEKKDEKKDAAAEKKDPEKKDAEKKDAAKKPDDPDDDKKAVKKTGSTSKREAKKADPVEERILKESMPMRARIYQTTAESNAGLTVELPSPFLPKVLAARTWLTQQLQLGNRSYEVINQYKQKLNAARQVEVKPGETIKVRTMNPPIEYDSKGNLKRWTPREIAALRGASKLPGFPAEFDAVRPGQIVDLYVAKTPPPKRAPRERPKKVEDDEDPLEEYPRPEVLMIVVLIEAPARP